MAFTQFFLGFLRPVGIGAAAVFALLFAIRFGTRRRSPAVIRRRPSR
jgi:hypothetical protein